MDFAFVLRYRLDKRDSNYDELAERLLASGCTDALVSINRAGNMVLEFLREDASASAALTSAIADVQRAIPSAELIDIRSDFMSS
ncbi:hypothetical protein GJ699_09810 [Duganella sp. FT80W]|jgi:hypothetical protein|uniref:DUF4911 domain-containing protein n=1 Tax=Duganella guangzhouensis TaxID=2666084 RepID=A0A6I2L1W8_9BURK|nr:hypothetical protein [Duganella guangzhouensis]MRW90279.1 hypothetical protein [Duganella guangzhouensis]